MKGLEKMLICNTEEEARELGREIKIWDGTKWFIGILWKTPDMVGTENFRVIYCGGVE